MTQKPIYRDLQRGCHEIRVLQPEPSSGPTDSLLKYKLVYIVLDRNSTSLSSTTPTPSEEAVPRKPPILLPGIESCPDTPRYIALSYTWGDQKDTLSIQVEGNDMKVTRNLHDALTALRLEPSTAATPVWADAVCINQKDTPEVNREVKRMAVIYQHAASVIVWLGRVPATWNFHGLEPTQDVNGILPHIMVHQEVETTGDKQDGDYTSDEILTLLAIFDRPYWRRIWILQELVCAQFEEIYFFWAGGLRHISVLHGINDTFSKAVSAWLDSEKTASFLKGAALSNMNAERTTSKSSSTRATLSSDDKWQEESVRIVGNQAHANLGSTKPASDVEAEIEQAVITGQEVDLTGYMSKFSSTSIVQKLMEVSFSGEKLDVRDYLQECLQEDSGVSVSMIREEMRKMATAMADTLRELKEYGEAISSVSGESEWRIFRKEIDLEINELAMTALDIIFAASIDRSRTEVDFGLLIRHAFFGDSTKPVDLVYGLLGLHREDIVSRITVDVNLPKERVFSDFSAAVIQSRGLNVLCELGVDRLGYSSTVPSWAFNFSNTLDNSALGGQLSRKWRMFGAGGSAHNVQFSSDNSQLICPGLLYAVDLKTPKPHYFSEDLIRQALERVVSSYHPDDEPRRSIFHISPESTNDDPEVSASLEIYKAFQAIHSDFAIEGFRLADLFPTLDDIEQWDVGGACQALKTLSSQIFFTTMDGKLGLGASSLRHGDYITVLQGCNIPVVLRECPAGFHLIGMCYVDDLMLGEALDLSPDWRKLVIV